MPEPHLNGAYYGPSIPPPSKKSYRPGRGGGSSCNPFSCCCGCIAQCICNCVFQILCTLAVVLGVIILVLWLVFRPNKVKIHADDAALTQFEFSPTNNTLYYDLALNLTVRNPNKRIGIYYDTIEANALYQGQRFKTVNLDPFYQHHKNTTDLHLRFQGQQLIPLSSDQVSNYNNDKNSKVYGIDLKLNFRIRLKFWWFKSPKVKPKMECDLEVPLIANGTSSGTFQSKRCYLDW
ncbi:OLC1v1034085C1 [Oldenlandia corymbosa var. corymbosa]|uniref:OLC1v1034085C1 n=1 Tax=Oldenlandia corymbosa var. corymbosa TaxID=529605 RepID=A0AAV1CSC6_OLDCO|nr:OLC1v1034085C1 [Oldenlandia corymbosa var. corymbosa]